MGLDICMEQAAHFLEESNLLYSLVSSLPESQFGRPTQFKSWTVNDILVHLHFWNRAADLALNDPDAFTDMFERLYGALKEGKLRDHENALIKERGFDLVAVWRELYADMGIRWQKIDPKQRVKWAGPDMSVRSSISARQMETWAHGQAVFDLLGESRQESDRIRNIVILGVNAFGWSHKVRGLEPKGPIPLLNLSAPSGDLWAFGEANSSGEISGDAVEFCQVVTQTRNIADCELKVEGKVARFWMRNAQCFAGPPETPPAPGARTIEVG